MSLARIGDLAQKVAPDVAAITGKSFAQRTLRFVEDDGDIANDTTVSFARDLQKQERTAYGALDHVIASMPHRSLKRLADKVAIRLSRSTILMKMNGNEGVTVNPTVYTWPDQTLEYLLAHELTHVSDHIHYNMFERRFGLLQEVLVLSLRELALRHTNGIWSGYLHPSSGIVDLEKRQKDNMAELENLMTIAESHAEYVGDRFLERRGLAPQAYMSGPFALYMLKTLPIGLAMKLFPEARKKISQYKDAHSLITEAYKNGIQMERIYADIPIGQDFSDPTQYLARQSESKP